MTVEIFDWNLYSQFKFHEGLLKKNIGSVPHWVKEKIESYKIGYYWLFIPNVSFVESKRWE